MTIAANVTVSGGSAASVSFFNQTTLLGSVQAPPFNFTAKNLAAGAYSLSAVATASGVSGTSGVVHVTVVVPLDITLSPPVIKNGSVSFSYTANPGLTYVVQRASKVNSSNSFDWSPVVTNTVTSNPANYSEGMTTDPAHCFRVRRLSNP